MESDRPTLAPKPDVDPTASFVGGPLLEQVLTLCSLQEYRTLFEAQAVGDDVLHTLTSEDLKTIGVNVLGDRKRLLKAIRAVQAQEVPADNNSATSSALGAGPASDSSNAEDAPSVSTQSNAPSTQTETDINSVPAVEATTLSSESASQDSLLEVEALLGSGETQSPTSSSGLPQTSSSSVLTEGETLDFAPARHDAVLPASAAHATRSRKGRWFWLALATVLGLATVGILIALSAEESPKSPAPDAVAQTQESPESSVAVTPPELPHPFPPDADLLALGRRILAAYDNEDLDALDELACCDLKARLSRMRLLDDERQAFFAFPQIRSAQRTALQVIPREPVESPGIAFARLGTDEYTLEFGESEDLWKFSGFGRREGVYPSETWAGACKSSAECENGYCVQAICYHGTVGDPCDTGNRCARGFLCKERVCAAEPPKAPSGDRAESSSPESNAQGQHSSIEAAAAQERMARSRAQALNEKGLAARKSGDHAKAAEYYVEALRLDSGHVWARYNYACELNLAGRRSDALHHLRLLREMGSKEASEALKAARKDTDFRTLWNTGEFKSLTTL